MYSVVNVKHLRYSSELSAKMSIVSSISKRTLAILIGTLMLSLSVYATPSVHAQPPTSTTVNCNPTIFGPGTGMMDHTVCTATVTGTGGGGPLPPTGTVNFMASAPGTFSPAPGSSFSPPSGCILGPGPGLMPNQSACSVTWMPDLIGPATVETITADYSGDPNNSPSSGFTDILVLSGPLATITTAVCNASKLPDHKSTTCTATVRNATPVPPSFPLPPGGTVSWTCSPSPCGSFTPPSCLLSPTIADPANMSSCTTTFTAMAGKPITVTITAFYNGDMIHTPSSGTTTIKAGS